MQTPRISGGERFCAQQAEEERIVRALDIIIASVTASNSGRVASSAANPVPARATIPAATATLASKTKIASISTRSSENNPKNNLRKRSLGSSHLNDGDRACE